MERKFLEGLELDAATVDKIMAEHGKSTQANQTKVKELEGQLSAAQSTITAANSEIERYKGLDIDGIKKAADEWKAKAEKAEGDAKAQLDSIRFDSALDAALATAKARNPKAAKALLNLESLKLTDSGIVGLTEQLKTIKEENAFLFEPEPAGGPGFGNQDPPGTAINPNDHMNRLIRGARGAE